MNLHSSRTAPGRWGVMWLGFGLLFLPFLSQADEFKAARAKVQRVEDCTTLLEAFPDRLAAYQCYWREARRQKRQKAARKILEQRLEKHPGDHRARLYLGYVLADLYAPEAKDTLLEAAQALRQSEDGPAEVAALMLLNFLFRARGDLATAQTHLERAEVLASGLQDPVMLARVRIELAMNAYYRRDYTHAWTTLKGLEGVLDEKTESLRSRIYFGLSAVASVLGRAREAFDYRQKEIEVHRRNKDADMEAEALAHLAGLAGQVKEPRPFSDAELLRFAQTAYDAAVQVQDPLFIANAHGLLGDCISLSVPERLSHQEKSLAGFKARNFSGGILKRLIGIASLYIEQGLEPQSLAFDRLAEAIDLARKVKREEYLAMAWRLRARLRWLTGTPEQAAAESAAAIEATEAIFDPIQSPQVHLEALGRFASEYRFFSGAILRHGPVKGTQGPELAFRIIERIRARMLLSRQADGTDPKQQPANPVRDKLLAQQIDLQKSLLDPRLDPAKRAQKLVELANLETAILAAEQTESRGLSSRQLRKSIAGLDQVQAALQPGQAILAYQLADKERMGPSTATRKIEGGGSWLLLISRTGLTVWPLPSRELIDGRVQLFLGLLGRRDGRETQGARLLYADLLSPALESLPADTRQLIIVPDGSLHRLPFAALQAPDGQILAATHQISMAPSVTIWLRWRQSVERPHPRCVLALSDPALGSSESPDSKRDGEIFRRGIELGRLPNATVEAQDLLDSLGGDKQWLWDGAAASESRLKAAPLAEFAILHLAAHALVDEDNPHRSAVILAPGSEREDGLLQIPEIAELDLRGVTVLLSSCRALGGVLLEGEGIMSLSRSFFLGGARAVVGNLWSLRDDEARLFFTAVGEGIADGQSIGQAFSETQRAWLDEGRPSATWAGFVLQGDGTHVPFPGGVSRPLASWGLLLASAGLALLLLLAAVALWRRFSEGG